MPRKKEYDREEVLQKATAVFWEKGFEGTSMKDLVAATGLNRFSMYDAFENKEGLFKEVLRFYMSQMEDQLFVDMRDNAQGLASIYAFYDRLLELIDSGGNMTGCLVLNTAVDCPCREKVIMEMVQDQYRKSQDLLEACLQLAKNKGEISSDADPGALAQYLVGINHAMMVMQRIHTPIEETRSFLDTALKNLRPLSAA